MVKVSSLMRTRPFTAIAMTLCMVFSACSTEKQAAGTGAPTAIHTANLNTNTVPALSLKMECKECVVSPEVQKAILDAYQQAATKSDIRIDPNRQATLTITAFSSRGFKRFLGPFGLATTDEIKGKVSSTQREFQVKESARVPFRSIEYVANGIGQAAFDGLQGF